MTPPRPPKSRVARISDPISEALTHGRTCYERGDWKDAYEALSIVNEQSPLGAADLERLAWSAGLIARDEDMLAIQERVCQAWLDEGAQLPAARAAFWLGFRLLARGELNKAN